MWVSFLLASGGLAHVRRGVIIFPAKNAIEVREITESAFECDGPNRAVHIQRSAQHAMRAQEALAEREFGKAGAFAFEQRAQTGRPDTAPARHFHGIAGRPDDHGSEI